MAALALPPARADLSLAPPDFNLDEMSGVEVLAAVAAVISAFHGGAELVRHIKKRHKKKKSEQAYKENALEESLWTGKNEVQHRYAEDYNELGDRFRIGDEFAARKLWQIHSQLQQQITFALQIALAEERAILNFTILHDASVLHRRDAIETLNGLRQRIVASVPLSFFMEAPGMVRGTSVSSTDTFRTAAANQSVQYLPAGVTVPEEEPEAQPRGLRRLWSKRTPSNGGEQPLSPQNSNLPAILPPPPQPPQPLQSPQSPQSPQAPPPLQPRHPQHHYHGYQQNQHQHQQYPQPLQQQQHHRSQQLHAPNNPALEWNPPMPYGDPGSPNDVAARLQGLQLAWSPLDKTHSIAASSEYSQHSDSNGSASPQFRPESFASHSNYRPDSVAAPPPLLRPDSMGSPTHYRPDSTNAPIPLSISPDPQPHGFHPGYGPVQRQEEPPPPLRRESQSIITSTITKPTRKTIHGRPSKSNSYYGFCKGSWETRDDIPSGIEIRSRPDGYSMYSTTTVWSCKFCSYEGPVFGAKKPYKFDERIHKSASGIRYRWIFLVKSHVKKKMHGPDKKESNYGCVFCVDEGQGTSVYGNVETLMNHIIMEHSKPMSAETQQRMRCVQGRTAIDHEAFDINIPTCG